MQVRRERIVWGVIGSASGLAMAVAAYLLIAPVVAPTPAIPFQDKLYHAVIFAGLTGPGVLVLPRKYLWFWLVHILTLGVGIEIVQARAEQLGRSGDVVDFLADVVGILAALGVGRAIRSRFERPPAASGDVAST